jgi:hypothetical protein
VDRPLSRIDAGPFDAALPSTCSASGRPLRERFARLELRAHHAAPTRRSHREAVGAKRRSATALDGGLAVWPPPSAARYFSGIQISTPPMPVRGSKLSRCRSRLTPSMATRW